MVTGKLRHKKPDGDTSELRRARWSIAAHVENARPTEVCGGGVGSLEYPARLQQRHRTIGAVIEWAREGKGRTTLVIERGSSSSRASAGVKQREVELVGDAALRRRSLRTDTGTGSAPSYKKRVVRTSFCGNMVT